MYARGRARVLYIGTRYMHIHENYMKTNNIYIYIYIYIHTYIHIHIYFFVKVSLHEYTKIVDIIKSKFSTCFLFCVYFFKKISQAANLHFKSPKKTLKSIVHDRYSCSNTPSCLFFKTLFTMKNWWS